MFYEWYMRIDIWRMCGASKRIEFLISQLKGGA